MLADELAAAKVGVILDPYVYGPGGFDQIYGRADNAKLLTEAGVVVAITTGSTHNIRNLRQAAGNAVRAGLEHADAIKALTQNVATLFEQKNYGNIVVGGVANLVVWSENLLSSQAKLSKCSSTAALLAWRAVKRSFETATGLCRWREKPDCPSLNSPLKHPGYWRLAR